MRHFDFVRALLRNGATLLIRSENDDNNDTALATAAIRSVARTGTVREGREGHKVTGLMAQKRSTEVLNHVHLNMLKRPH